MKEAVGQVEVDSVNDRNQRQQDDEPHRVRLPVVERQQAVGEGPQRDRLIGRPGGHAAGQSPEHVVTDLMAKQEGAALGRQGAGVVFELRPLTLKNVQIQVQGAVNEERQRQGFARR